MARFGARSNCRLDRIALLAGALTAFLGCEKRPEIAHYQVPKEAVASEQMATDETAGNSEPTDRMLAAIVPHDQQAWFFKLTGLEADVSKNTEAFESFVKTVSFAEGSGGKPKWNLPEGWKETSEAAEMRYSTISVPTDGEPLKLTISMPLPWKGGDDQELLINVNRWRGQMQLPPVETKDLAKDTRSLKLADANGDAIVVDLRGRLKTGGMTPPFAGKAFRGDLPAGHPPIADSKGQPAATRPANNSAKSPPPASGSTAANSMNLADLPLTFSVPEGWKPTKPSSMFVMLAFNATVDAKSVAITISQARGSTVANVNRWRDQVDLPPVGDGELGSIVHPFKVDGLNAQMVRLFGPEGTDDRKAILAAIVPQDEVTWFFKMMGPTDAVEHEQTNFEKFLDSVKFRGER
jgi:hypothetical protein